jgi:hypothetical protein
MRSHRVFSIICTKTAASHITPRSPLATTCCSKVGQQLSSHYRPVVNVTVESIRNQIVDARSMHRPTARPCHRLPRMMVAVLIHGTWHAASTEITVQ